MRKSRSYHVAAAQGDASVLMVLVDALNVTPWFTPYAGTWVRMFDLCLVLAAGRAVGAEECSLGGGCHHVRWWCLLLQLSVLRHCLE